MTDIAEKNYGFKLLKNYIIFLLQLVSRFISYSCIYILTLLQMAKKTITIPKPQARLMQAYLKFSEMARKQGKFLLLRDFVAYAQEQGWTEEKTVRYD